MLNRKRSALSIALAVALTPLMASAQTAEPTTATPPTGTTATNLDTVQVTGIRRGIENAIAIKQDATSVVEAIHLAPARPGRPARGRSCPGDQRARPVARLRHHPAQRA